MSKVMLRYEIKDDKTRMKAIRGLLKEIGGKNYWRAVADCGEVFMEQKPIGVYGHYLEYECDTSAMFLYYRYSGGTIIKILQVNGFWKVPEEGWDMFRKD